MYGESSYKKLFKYPLRRFKQKLTSCLLFFFPLTSVLAFNFRIGVLSSICVFLHSSSLLSYYSNIAINSPLFTIERLDILEGCSCKVIPPRLYTNIMTLRLSNEVK